MLILSILDCRKFKNTYYRNRIMKIIIILLIIVLNIFFIKEKINDIYQAKGYNKSLIVQDISIYYYHYEDAKDYFSSLFGKEKIDEEKFQTVYDNCINVEKTLTDYTGIAQDSNVIILQLESLNEYIIGKQVNGKEITPNLNKFFNDNIYCSDMYNQGLGSTADSEFEMENSMYPLENGYVFQKYYNNTWLDIYSTLRENGYYTSFMHPNTSTFWNRDEVYNTGYQIDEYNDINSLQNIEQAGEFYSDEGFLEEAVQIMNSYEGKFCTILVSVTTHIPFYLDGVSDLENKVTITQDDVSEFEDYIKEVHVPFGMKIPGLECNDTIKRSAAKIDIKPTILDLLDVEDKFSIGNTIFSGKDYSFIKGLGYVTSTNYCINGIYYDREKIEEIEENEDLQSLLKQMEDEIYLSDTIIKNDLIKDIM